VKPYLENIQSCQGCGSPIIQLPTGPVRTCKCSGGAQTPAILQQAMNSGVSVELLSDVVEQACVKEDDKGNVVLDSQGKKAYAEAILCLAEHGKCKVIGRQGRRILAVWI
jgi:predicted RNA-binding protein YlqC (UPF0109 family)